MPGEFTLRVVSVEESLFEGPADFVLASGGDGELGILPHHAPLLSTLKPGPLVIRHGGQETLLLVGGGFLEVLPDRVTVLADAAERAGELSEQAAEEARRHAADALEHAAATAEDQTALQAELEMAEARLRLARIRRGR